MGRTKKVGITGKHGVRYGLSIRKRNIAIGRMGRAKCPNCLRSRLERVSSGIWRCSRCGAKLAGKAYKPS